MAGGEDSTQTIAAVRQRAVELLEQRSKSQATSATQQPQPPSRSRPLSAAVATRQSNHNVSLDDALLNFQEQVCVLALLTAHRMNAFHENITP